MASSFYDISVASYLQSVGGVLGVLEKGAAHYRDNGMNIDDIVDFRLHPDMLPFSFQLRSVAHHSLGAIRGIQEGVFTPPPQMPEMDYAGLQAHVADAREQLLALDRAEVDALAGRSLVFRLSSGDIPFEAEKFVLSFSLPNLYFHATTAYDMLRMQGVPLGKLDFIGPLRAD